MKKQTLLPCPFCGGRATARYVPDTDEPSGGFWSVGCRSDNCHGIPVTTAVAKADAKAKWNRRAPARPGESNFRDAAGRTFQPIGWEMGVDGAPRVCFKRNAIVDFLHEHGGYDMNALARMDFTDEDRAQFAQLIGYSVSGWGELSYVPLKVARIADEIADRLAEQEPLLVAAKRLTKGGAS